MLLHKALFPFLLVLPAALGAAMDAGDLGKLLENATVNIIINPEPGNTAGKPRPKPTQPPQTALKPVKDFQAKYPTNSSAYKQVQYWFSGVDLNETEYRARNWMWIRCRAKYAMYYDIGGAWTEKQAQGWRERLNWCGIKNWKFQYYNGQNWGDASVKFTLDKDSCGPVHAVDEAINLIKLTSRSWKRNLHIFNCYGHEADPRYKDEKEVLRWNQANREKLDSLSSQRSWYHGSDRNPQTDFKDMVASWKIQDDPPSFGDWIPQ